MLIPTYNNDATLCNVINQILSLSLPIIVVNDGSTDDTLSRISTFVNNNEIHLVSYPKNRGKGHALCRGFKCAQHLGYQYAITLDADGQHLPKDIPTLMQALPNQPNMSNRHGAMIVGCRDLYADGMPRKNTFANRFSNFWFTIQTGRILSDTQSGFRIYDLNHLPSLLLITHRYESELELLVFSAWRGVQLVPVPVNVYYPPAEERVSHFRPGIDFFRISVLNTILCFLSVCYGYPRMGLRWLINKTSTL